MRKWHARFSQIVLSDFFFRFNSGNTDTGPQGWEATSATCQKLMRHTMYTLTTTHPILFDAINATEFSHHIRGLYFALGWVWRFAPNKLGFLLAQLHGLYEDSVVIFRQSFPHFTSKPTTKNM